MLNFRKNHEENHFQASSNNIRFISFHVIAFLRLLSLNNDIIMQGSPLKMKLFKFTP